MKLFFLSVGLLLNTVAWAADIAASGGWNRTITSGDLIAGAGTDLISQQESNSDATTLTITSTSGGAWRIKVRHTPGPWNNDLTLWIRRTSDGTGIGSISGGSGYIQVTTLDTEICAGTNDRSGISIQYKLSGLSKNVSPDSYLSSVLFTVE